MSTIAGSPPRPPSLAQRIWHSDNLAGWAFVLPAVFLVALFSIFPIIWGFVLSLQKASLLSPNRPFVGFDNYTQIAQRPARDQRGEERGRLHVPVRAVLDHRSRCSSPSR